MFYRVWNNEIAQLNRNKVLANLPSAVKTETYVLRPEEWAEIQLSVCAYIDSFDGAGTMNDYPDCVKVVSAETLKAVAGISDGKLQAAADKSAASESGEDRDAKNFAASLSS